MAVLRIESINIVFNRITTSSDVRLMHTEYDQTTGCFASSSGNAEVHNDSVAALQQPAS